jgi:ferric-dicitrate binding protein FerR (iron transport regulator)
VNEKTEIKQDVCNFLQDEDFIRWRLFQTKESGDYWLTFRIEHPHLEEALLEAIRQFSSVEINKHHLSETEKQRIYRSLLQNVSHHKQRRLMARISSAAAVLMIALLSVLYVTQKDDRRELQQWENDVIVGKALPEEEIYLIAAGKRINLARNVHIGLTDDGKAVITDSTASMKELMLDKNKLNKLVVPYGKRSNLTLSDGTEVWLNSGTQLDFPSKFNGKTREIHVDGEIFIDVAHNTKIPFIVHAQDMDILVQGTSFNISAYSDEHRKTVVLVEGRVNIGKGNSQLAELMPNEKIDITGNNIRKESVEVSAYISWKKGMLEFNATPMSEILKKIGRYYNVQFDSNSDIQLNDQTCSGKLFLSNNLDSVMRSVSILSSTEYKRENNIIHIRQKK